MSLTVGILTGGTNSHQTTAEEANGFVTDFISQGVVGAYTNTSGVAPATGAFAVNAQGTPNMTVAVTAGTAYVTGTPTSQNSQTFRVKNSASTNVTISANSSGSTKYDHLYIKLDPTKLANPAVGADDVATLVTSRSTSSSTDDGTPPTYGYKIAVITVSNGASSITNANITDSRTATGTTPGDSTVSTAKIADDAVTAAKIDWASTGAGAGIWWEEIGRTTLTSSADSISASFSARKFLTVLIDARSTGGTINATLRFNGDTGSNYAYRLSTNGGADSTSTSVSFIAADSGAASTSPLYSIYNIVNIASEEKLASAVLSARSTAGAANAPVRLEINGKWANTSSQITSVSITNSGTGDYAIGSEVIVLGHN